MNNLSDLEKKLSITFKQKKILENVFIHRSYLNEHKNFYLPSNEKLEFLGDSVLSLVTSLFLYQNYVWLKEGDYTEIKAAIVRTESLAYAAKLLKLGDYLLLSKGQDRESGRKNKNILADCFEALIGAIFLDQGFEKANSFILEYLFSNKLDKIIKNKQYLSPKSKLQEYTQAKFKLIPTYKLIEEIGPEHDRIFKVEVAIKQKKYGFGYGKSKKEAEEKAAKEALEEIK
ncbi:ribonuclease III [Candidatus Roizmanbacteria bacterium RIFCSPHIGHO2_02_FULL_37_15]|uniref:Ribonuclease 3 n=1 Tax=Candidatus Roizmanbacteria bacterium RIFCSPLOWO2_01_FULL_37_16 TaxID=1802058 RepID=A0A1F7IKR5_9BACT|nr:MAG: ribonuclease III [Candidatus Roizmanbacteria bacterium RIFCSPHIGHO2_01_FULL_37_16b]OGK22278.1 MAG: ribonuclease III [Candidatus Roizmanbacteria bacterium RIFCSPHIGHO2_02_FULL_37_15]OGK31791.1 MAG: ribonuclease III [Candidatus Roizmanbacteria bacterium RIFCSPHIGHO2_12_FULL_36_11]OGK43950.1 MAG: ribonuclease III [Candidatus Roizmanbacteria bacterium RIFCSPLOWO2_01_FULL_37_16]OGK56443.1 MAG: ribonuclease III [Candidatus Roizmanbacteria bacterium RIFCSPLOWO2_02_FULL_37_9]